MSVDPVVQKLRRRPAYIIGVVLLIIGLVPLAATLVFLPGSDGIAGGMMMVICVPPGLILISRERSRALREWREGK